ncbi:MAG: hypothetical protein ACPG8W_15490 [Candidatus Promineifilaceae bacterium]
MTATPLVLIATEEPAAVIVEEVDPTTMPPTDTPATDMPPTNVPVTNVPPTDTPIPVPTIISDDLALSAENINLYPVDQLYTNERVTFQVRAQVPAVVDPYSVGVHIFVDGEMVVDNVLGGNRNLNGDTIGLYQWAWNTGDLSGPHNVTIVLDPENSIVQGDENPDNNRAEFEIEVISAELAPNALENQVWETHETRYANIYVVAETSASRDIEFLKMSVDSAISQAAAVLQVPPVVDRKLNIYFIDRIIGQGGYAGSSIVISYLDRNYAGGSLYEVLVHEAIHVLDNNFESSDRFTFLTEGLAVWGTGGHYKIENLDQRAAGLLLDTERYIPLEDLINNFYPSQHEVGYLQAGAFVKYLVDIYGYDAMQRFFSTASYVDERTQAESISLAMRSHFGKTLAQLESDWHIHLQSQARTADASLDLELTIEFYDLMRDYQQIYDPTAYFLYAWLPFPDTLREEGITAEVTRHPRGDTRVALEAMLESADTALREGDFTTTRTLMDSVKRVLDNDGRFLDPISANYLQLVQKSAEFGYEAQDISITFLSGATPIANVVGLDLTTGERFNYQLTLEGSEWVVMQ